MKGDKDKRKETCAMMSFILYKRIKFLRRFPGHRSTIEGGSRGLKEGSKTNPRKPEV